MLNLIPAPLQYKGYNGICKFTNMTIITTQFKNVKNLFFAYIKSLESGLGCGINIILDKKLDSEQYKMVADGHCVNVSASCERSALYAIQTIIQLAGHKGEIKCCEIVDKPRYSWRGFMLDCARHFWSVAQIKNTLDIMSNLKLNIFHWHLTDDQGWRIEIKSRPLLTKVGSKRSNTQLKNLSSLNDNTAYGEGLFYTQKDIKEIVSYASKLGIDVVPEIDMPGHLVSAISCYKELSCDGVQVKVSNRWGVSNNIGCCGSDALYLFINDVLDEVTKLFPFEYFHIGGDEVPKKRWKACPKCQAKIAELGLNNEDELQGYFTNYVSEYIKPLGKKLIGWNEIVNATTLDKNTIIQWWTPSGDKDKILDFLKRGGKAILSKHQNFYLDHSYAIRPLERTYNFDYTMLGMTSDENVIGIEAPQWTEYIRTRDKLEFNTFPRMMALAENAWSMREKLNYQDFEKRLENNRQFFESVFDIKIANPFFYRGNSIKGKVFKAARAWSKWSADADYELKLSKK